eukprot:bmy_14902T0
MVELLPSYNAEQGTLETVLRVLNFCYSCFKMLILQEQIVPKPEVEVSQKKKLSRKKLKKQKLMAWK